MRSLSQWLAAVAALAALVAPVAPATASEDRFLEQVMLAAAREDLAVCRNMPLLGLVCQPFAELRKDGQRLVYAHGYSDNKVLVLEPGGYAEIPADYHAEGAHGLVVVTYKSLDVAIKRHKGALRVTLARESIYDRRQDGRLRLFGERTIELFLPVRRPDKITTLRAQAEAAGHAVVVEAIDRLVFE